MARLARVLRALLLLIISPLVLLLSVGAILLEDLLWLLWHPTRPPVDTLPSTAAASVVIPSWKGRELLEKYLPSVEAAVSSNPENEIIVVENGSFDGSVEMLQERFPGVRVLTLDRNLGFGGGSSVGVKAAKNDVVILLNSDMRVDAGFLQPLLEGFTDASVFAVSCQIFFSDPEKVREETGLTQGWWQDGSVRVRHRGDSEITDLYPCFYGGGGSCAFDRRKFIELGGFDPLFEPFYFEDTDLSYRAWKRGWKVLYQPRSIVYHEHRGTIGRRFHNDQIQAVLKKNSILFCWKNIHETQRVLAHFFFLYAASLATLVWGDVPWRGNLDALWRAFKQLPLALRSRWQARSLAVISDTEAFRRPLGGYFRDRFGTFNADAERLRVLFVSPYPLVPPIHGGGVFMYNAVRELARLAEVYVVALLDHPDQMSANLELRQLCASAEFLIRTQASPHSNGSIVPYAVREFESEELAWLIHRQLWLKQIDVLQLEYTALSQYAGDYRRLATAVFEHDIYFESIARGLPYRSGWNRVRAGFEYLRALRYELRQLPRCDRVQVCTRENREYLASFLPSLGPRLQEGLRAGIDTSHYTFQTEGREPFTMLFLGSFRHLPNRIGLEWFVRQVLPLVLERCPQARLIVAGAEAPPQHLYEDRSCAVELLGFVEDVREPLARYAVFVCPVLSGSGVRVKLLEAFASGIPPVSTRIGAEGLARQSGDVCLLADEPLDFARKILQLFDCPEQAKAMARRAREEVATHWDGAAITRRLEHSYREALSEKAERLRGSLLGQPLR